MEFVYEVIYVMIKENLTIHRKMKQKDLSILLQDENIELISVNENKRVYTNRKKVKNNG